MIARVRDERPGDAEAIRGVVERAFAGHEHSDGTEHDIVERLRETRAPVLSLVAQVGEDLVGHIAFSPVEIADGTPGWFGLGPLSVDPRHKRCGIGSALVETGLARLEAEGANGCVVLGEPGYYARFGFTADHALTFSGVPAQYFQSLLLAGDPPVGEVRYGKAFG